ncbi:hypothetical protein BST61_g1794 [Cercospora zeina]
MLAHQQLYMPRDHHSAQQNVRLHHVVTDPEDIASLPTFEIAVAKSDLEATSSTFLTRSTAPRLGVGCAHRMQSHRI